MKKNKSEWTTGKKATLGLIIFLILTFIITSFFGKKGLMKMFKYRNKIDQLENEILALEKKRKKLEVRVVELRDNLMTVEPIARKDLWYKKEGELVYILRDRQNQ